ncbi:MAG: PhnD/SsuA/transferrin family substrate-binding protein, partial [Ignavibacteria bacterium]
MKIVPLILIIVFAFIFITCKDNYNVKEINISSNNKLLFQAAEHDSIPVLYFAVSTMISSMETFNLYKDVMDYISKKIGMRIEFKQRKTYQEVNKLLKENKLDFAFICTGAYIEARNEIPIEIL